MMSEAAHAVSDAARLPEAAAAEAVDSAPATVRSCLCRLGGQVFAVDIPSAREVMVVQDYTVVPRAPSHVLGVVHLRGRIVPLVDIGPLLGLAPSSIGRGATALVVEGGALELAIPVQEVLGLETLCQSVPVEEAAARAGGSWLRRLRRDGEPVDVLDVPEIAEALRVRSPAAAAAEGETDPLRLVARPGTQEESG